MLQTPSNKPRTRLNRYILFTWLLLLPLSLLSQQFPVNDVFTFKYKPTGGYLFPQGGGQPGMDRVTMVIPTTTVPKGLYHLFFFQDAGNGYNYITHLQSGWNLSVNTSRRSRLVGIGPRLYPMDNSQLWKVEKTIDGEYVFTNKLYNSKLMMYDFGTSNHVEAIDIENFLPTDPRTRWNLQYEGSNDLCKLTIESVKCIKPSSGQDIYTKVLFKGIEVAIQGAMAMASGGSSLTGSLALQIGKETLKKGIKKGLKVLAKDQVKKMIAANKEEILGLAKKVGVNTDGSTANTIAKVAGVAEEVYELTTLQGIFNKVYGESPDQLYINVNSKRVWPDNDAGADIRSQQQFNLGVEYIFNKSKGFSIQLMEYDYGSNDDDLGTQFFEIPPEFVGTDRIVEQVFDNTEEEGSLYLVTFKVETLLKHQFITSTNLAGSSWDLTYENGAAIILNFGSGTIDVPGNYSGWQGLKWYFVNPDDVKLYGPQGQMGFMFISENDFTGYSWDGKTPVFGKRRTPQSQQQQQQQQAFPHRFINNNLIGSSWNYKESTGGVFTFTIGQGVITNFSYPGAGWEGATWKVIGPDKIQLMATTGATMDLTFYDYYNFSGFAWNNGNNPVIGNRR